MKDKVNVHIEDAILWEMVVDLTKENPNNYDLGEAVRLLVMRMTDIYGL